MNRLVSLYIHIPFCAHKCRYCAFYSSPQNFDLIPQYIEALKKELGSYTPNLKDYTIETIFIGGGTPSLIEASYINDILMHIRSNVSVSKKAEITIESNPETLTKAKLDTYHKAGINRISIGMQADQDHLLKFLGRTYTSKYFDQSVRLVKDSPINNVNLDLIFGIPGQTIEDWQHTLDKAISYQPNHISAYSLMIEKNTAFHRLFKMGKLQKAPEELDRKMYHYTIKTLKKSGYHQYEISNFAKDSYQCQHNLRFWQGGEYIGIGTSASSSFQNKIYTNIANTKKYIENPINNTSQKYKLNNDQQILHYLTLNLRITDGVDIVQFNKLHKSNLKARFRSQLLYLTQAKLIDQTKTHIKLTIKGMDLENQVAEILAS